jgi:hypothetical protein
MSAGSVMRIALGMLQASGQLTHSNRRRCRMVCAETEIEID